MNKFYFKGPETNLGRFGVVGKGSVLTLTEHEEGCIRDDERFESYNPDKHGDAIPEGSDLAKANDTNLVFALELVEKSKEELLVLAAQLQSEGKPIQFKPSDSHEQILEKVKQAMRFDESAQKGKAKDRFKQLDKLSLAKLRETCVQMERKGINVAWHKNHSKAELISAIINAETGE